MPFEFKLPSVSEGIEEATVTQILIAEGDTITADQPVMEIETEKATLEIPADVAGVVSSILVKEGDTIAVGATVLIIEQDDRASAKTAPKKTKKAAAKKTEPAKKEKAAAPAVKKAAAPVAKSAAVVVPMKRRNVPAAPSVRRFAREIGIDITQVPGSGPGGRIAVDDVKAYSKQLNQGRVSSSPTAQIKLPDFSKWGDVDSTPMTKIQKIVGERMAIAWSTVPHVHQYDQADISELEKIRKDYNTKHSGQRSKLTVTAVLIKVLAGLLEKYPKFNCSIDTDSQQIIYKKYYNIGIAVDSPQGLLVPVIRDADKKSVLDIVEDLDATANRARDGKMHPNEMQGGTFTISNLGGIGGTSFNPIINAPEVAILGVARASYQQVYDKTGEGQLQFILPLTLAYDHRVVDGALGARFLREVCEILSDPLQFMLDL